MKIELPKNATPDRIMIHLGVFMIVGAVSRGITASNQLLWAGAFLLCIAFAWRSDLHDGVSYYGGPPERVVWGAVAQRGLFFILGGASLFALVKGHFPFA